VHRAAIAQNAGPARVLGELSVCALLSDVSSACTQLFEHALTDRPRDVLAGAASGCAYMGTGALACTLALTTAPLRGAREGGWKGCAEGMGRGLLGAIVIPAAAVGAASWQLGWGLAGTPEAIVQCCCCAHSWDAAAGEWSSYSLDQELADVRALGTRRQLITRLTERLSVAFTLGSVRAADGVRHAHANEATASSPSATDGTSPPPPRARSTRTVASRELYDRLGVEPDASAAEIRRAYRALALEAHPDRRRGDPVAVSEFQALVAAYRVLSSREARAVYDAQGQAAADTAGQSGRGALGLDGALALDLSDFVASMFGSEQFEYLAGNSSVAAMVQVWWGAVDHPAVLAARHAAEDAANPAFGSQIFGAHHAAHVLGRWAIGAAALRAVQRHEEVEVAAKLLDMLAPFASASVGARLAPGGASAGGSAAAAAAGRADDGDFGNGVLERFGFEPFWTKEAKRLAACHLGRPLLLELADAYRTAARVWGGTHPATAASAGRAANAMADGIAARWDDARASYALHADLATTLLIACKALLDMMRTGVEFRVALEEVCTPAVMANGAQRPPLSAAATAMLALPSALMHTAWAIRAIEVRSTALSAAERVLCDGEASPRTRRARADSLLLLATIFEREGRCDPAGEVGADVGAAGTEMAVAPPAAAGAAVVGSGGAAAAGNAARADGGSTSQPTAATAGVARSGAAAAGAQPAGGGMAAMAPPTPTPLPTQPGGASTVASRKRAQKLAAVAAECAHAKDRIESAGLRVFARARERMRERSDAEDAESQRRDATGRQQAAGRDVRATGQRTVGGQ
jgi:DnaJ-domain-containing protein 1